MGGLYVPTSDTAAVRKWARYLSMQHTDQCHALIKNGGPLTKQVGDYEPADAAVVYNTQLENSAGYTIRHHFMAQAQISPVVGTAGVKGKEGSVEWAKFDYSINNYALPLRNKNPMNEQIVPFKLNQSMVSLLAQNSARKFWIGALLHWSGYEGLASSTYVDDSGLEIDVNDLGWTFNNSVGSTSANSIFRPDSQTTDEGVEGSASGYVTLDGLDEMTEAIKNRRWRLRPPVEINGQGLYPMIVPVEFTRRLRQDTRWQTVQDQILASNLSPQEHYYLKGSMGVWYPYIFYETKHCPPGFNSSTKAALTKTWRCPVIGCESLCIANGQGYSADRPLVLKYDHEDYDRELGMAAIGMCGMDRPRITDPNGDGDVDVGVHVGVWRMLA